MVLELKRYLFMAFPYTLCTTLAALIIWEEDIKKHLPRLLLFTLLSAATQTATYAVGNEALRFPLEVAAGFVVALIVFRNSWQWILKIYGTSYVIGIAYALFLLPTLVLVENISLERIFYDPLFWLYRLVPSFILLVIIAMIIRKMRPPFLNILLNLRHVGARLWPVFIALFIQMVVFCALISENYDTGVGFHDLTPILTLVVTIILFFISILILILFIHYNRRDVELAAQDAMSDNIRELINAIRGQRHDFLNHLQVISILQQQNKQVDLEAYLHEMLHESSRYNEILKIDNPILSALINAKITQAETRGIELAVDIRSGFAGLAQHSMVIARILGNLIDNALDEVDKSPDSKKVELQVIEKGPFFIVSVSNPFSGNPDEVERAIKRSRSTKGPGHSGLGINICRRLARKIHSDFNYAVEPGHITFTLTIPK